MVRGVTLAVVMWLWAGASWAAGPACTLEGPQPGAVESSSVALHLVPMGGSQSPGETVWQAPGGVITFTLKPAPEASVVGPIVCFRIGTGPYLPAEHVALLPDSSVGTATYAATLPHNLQSNGTVQDPVHIGLVARIGDVRVVLQGKDQQPVVLTQTIGVTSVNVSGALAVLAVLLAFLFVERVARSLNVPGTWLLRVISTANGVASLSQLQVTLWTFVIGAGAVYVMAISGGLIEVSPGTLTLLGIAGVTTVGSKLQAAQADTPTGGATAPSGSGAKVNRAPEAVTNVAVVPGIATDTEMTLAWVPAAALPPARAFRVEYQVTGSQGWMLAETGALVPRCRVVGLQPETSYTFQVTPINEYNPGPSTQSQAASTLKSPAMPVGAPAQVIGLSVTAPERRDGISISWAPVAGARDYVVRARARAIDSEWVECGATEQTGMTITTSHVARAERFEIKVAARSEALLIGPWSAILSGRPQRTPRWSDLVIKPADATEIDVTRVQMLFFTVITALFVAIKVIVTYAIPEIPEGFLLLMGISNGIYLTAKFIPD